MSGYRVSVVGVTGAVGQAMLKCLADRKFPVSELVPLASNRSAGKQTLFQNESLMIKDLADHQFGQGEIVISSAGASTTRTFREKAVAAGATIVDNTSAYRLDESVPLVVPEINADQVRNHHGIIANPNCCAAILTVAIWPLYQLSRIRRMVLSTYQSASGAGAKAMEELKTQCGDILEGREAVAKVLPHQAAFNVFSHNSAIEENGYNGEENKVVEETRKIFGDPEIGIAVTCVRVPVLRAHSEAVNLEFEECVSVEAASEAIAAAPGLELVDDSDGNRFPMPIDATGRDEVLVGRIREDQSRKDGRGLELFISGDQLLKGAALNAVQVAEELIKLNGKG